MSLTSEPVTEESLRAAWKNELSDPAIFEKYLTHPFNNINAENLERNLYCLNCEEIRFRNEKGTIFIARGSGEMILPAKIGVLIKGGKSRVTERP